MVIAVCSFASRSGPSERRVAACIGSAAPTPLRATEAEEFIAGALDWDGLGAAIPDATRSARFGELVGAAARPIDDVRGTAAYRTPRGRRARAPHAGWAWEARTS